jgi:hypothetical protein
MQQATRNNAMVDVGEVAFELFAIQISYLPAGDVSTREYLRASEKTSPNSTFPDVGFLAGWPRCSFAGPRTFPVLDGAALLEFSQCAHMDASRLHLEIARVAAMPERLTGG